MSLSPVGIGELVDEEDSSLLVEMRDISQDEEGSLGVCRSWKRGLAALEMMRCTSERVVECSEMR